MSPDFSRSGKLIYGANTPTVDVCNLAATTDCKSGWYRIYVRFYGKGDAILANAETKIWYEANKDAKTKACLAKVTSTCAPYLTQYIKLGARNDAASVRKLQSFLKKLQGFDQLKETGVYDKATFEAVKTFQLRYAKDILTNWKTAQPTGYVYLTTVKKVNQLWCASIQEQQAQKTAQQLSACLAGGSAPVATVCTPYLTKNMKLGSANDKMEVQKLQTFLRDTQNAQITVTGTYDAATEKAVRAFQTTYAKDILTPVRLTEPTGIVQQLTIKKVNALVCQK